MNDAEAIIIIGEKIVQKLDKIGEKLHFIDGKLRRINGNLFAIRAKYVGDVVLTGGSDEIQD